MALSGEHIILEPLLPEHADELWPLADDDVIRAYWPVPLRTKQAMVDQCNRPCGRDDMEAYLIRTNDGQAAGATAFYAIDPDHNKLTIGWTFILEPYRRSPVNTEAKLLLLTEAFEGRGMERVEFEVDSRNTRSREAVLRIGATQEGILRRHKTLWDGYVRDTVVFSIIKDEWLAVKAQLEAKLA